MNKKGIALILGFVIILVLAILSSAIISRSISESNFARRNAEAAQAFWLAEAGVNRALDELRSDYSATGTGQWLTTLGSGQYNVDVAVNGQKRTVTGHGYVPSLASPRTQRDIQAILEKNDPPNFYDYAIYAAGNIASKSNAFTITGDVIYAGTIATKPGNITGSVTDDPSINPLAQLDYDQLRVISQAQGNYHDASHLNGPFPASFWYNEPAGIPNVVFLEGSLKVNAKDIGGFFVLAQNGDVTYDADIGGNFSLDGCIYTQGNVKLDGGGSVDLNVDGGIWSGKNSTLNGGITVAYNAVYMNAIKLLNIVMVVQISSWRDTHDPYYLTHH
jgi:hypothetical protein